MAKVCKGTKTDFQKKVVQQINKWMRNVPEAMGDPEAWAYAVKQIYLEISKSQKRDITDFQGNSTTAAQIFMDNVASITDPMQLGILEDPDPVPEVYKVDINLIDIKGEYLDSADFFSVKDGDAIEIEDKGTSEKLDDGDSIAGDISAWNTDLSVWDTKLSVALGRKVSPSDLVTTKFLAENNTFVEFYDELVKKFPELPQRNLSADIQIPIKVENALRKIFLANQPINKSKIYGKNSDRRQINYTNVDPKKLIEIVENADGPIVPEDLGPAILETGQKRLIPNLPFDIKTLTGQGEFATSSFVEASPVEIDGVPIGKLTIQVPVQGTRVLYYTEEGDNVSVNSWAENDPGLRIIKAKLHNFRVPGRELPLAITGMKSGESGAIFTTIILPKYIKQVLQDKGYIHSRLKKLSFKLIKNTAKMKDGAEYRNLLELSKSLSYSAITDYFNKEVADGNMNEQNVIDYQDRVKSIDTNEFDGFYDEYPHIEAAGMIATHEWWKHTRGNKYMMSDNQQKAFDRARLTHSIGFVPVGMGATKHIIYDHKQVDLYLNGEKIESTREVAGQSDINDGDGVSFTTTDLMNRTAITTGRRIINPSREGKLGAAKTVFSWLDPDNLDNYIDIKHSEQIGIVGLEAREKGTDRVIFRIFDDNGDVGIVNGRNQPIDFVHDFDAVKTHTGEYDVDATGFKQIELPEEARRIISLPGARAHKSTPGPDQWFGFLEMSGLDPKQNMELDKFKEYVYSFFSSEGSKYLNAFHKMFDDPNYMRKIAQNIYVNKDNANEDIREWIEKTEGIGIHHPTILGALKPMLFNLYIIDGVMQSRSFHDRTAPNKVQPVKGSSLVLRPDRGGKVVKDEGHIVIGSDNKEIFNQVNAMMAQKEKWAKPEWKDFQGLTETEKVDLVNIWLENNDVSTLDYRFPIDKFGSMVVGRIQQFNEGIGNTILLHANVVTGRMTADFDIDKTALMVVPTAVANEFRSFFKKPWVEALVNSSADVNIFKDKDHPRMSQSPLLAMSEVLDGVGSRGQATNARILSGKMAKIFGDITFSDGAILRPKALTDRVLMDYLPLKDDMTTEYVRKGAPAHDPKVRTKGGVKYLETTLDHELSLIMNLSFDHPKKLMLGDMIYNYFSGTLESFPSFGKFLINRTFDIVNPGDAAPGHISQDHLTLLRKIIGLHKTNDLRKGFNPARTMKGDPGGKLPMNHWYDKMHDLDDYLSRDGKGKAEYIMDENNGIFIPERKNQDALTISNIEINDYTPVQDRIVMSVVNKAKLDGNRQNPGTERRAVLANAHYATMTKNGPDVETTPMNQLQVDINNRIGLGKEPALKWGRWFWPKYYQLFYRGVDPSAIGVNPIEDKTTMNKVEFIEDLKNLVNEGEKRLNLLVDQYGPVVKEYTTMRFLMGFGEINNVYHFAPIRLYDENLIKNYMQRWENTMQAIDANGDRWVDTMKGVDKRAKRKNKALKSILGDCD